ncbi:hypothetical protein JW948_12855 [bacterium]|nr:hypothetical protein [bacterium]
MFRTKTGKKRQRRWLRRLFRIGFWTGAVLMLILIALIVVVRIRYPEPRILALLSENVASSTGMPLSISDVTWKLPLRLDIRDIRLGYPDSDPAEEAPFVSLNRFSVNFRLITLLRRRLLYVQSVTLDRPQVFLDPAGLARLEQHAGQDSVSNASPARDSASRTTANLPVALGLSSLRLNDFSGTVILPDSEETRMVTLSGLNLEMDHLYVPRNVGTSLMDLRGSLHVYTDGGKIRYQDSMLNTIRRTSLDLRASWQKNEAWLVQGGLALASDTEPARQIRMTLDLKGEGKGDVVHIDPVTIEVGPDPWLTIRGTVRHAAVQPEYRIEAESVPIGVRELTEVIRNLVPAAFVPGIEQISVDADLRKMNALIEGDSRGFQYQAVSEIQEGHAVLPGPVRFDGVYAALTAEGAVRAGRLIRNLINGRAGFDRAVIPLNDTLSMDGGPFALQFDSRLDSSRQRQGGVLNARLDGILNGGANLNWSWMFHPERPFPEEFVSMNGFLTADSLDLALIPGMDPGIHGTAGIRIQWVMPGLTRAFVDIGAEISRCTYDLEAASGSLPPITLASSMEIGTDMKFELFRADSVRIRLNDLIDARLSAQFQPASTRFHAELRPLVFHAGPLPAYFPDNLKEMQESLTFDAMAELTAVADGRASKPDDLSVQGRLVIEDAWFSETIRSLSMLGLHTEIGFSGTPVLFQGDGLIEIGKADLGPLRSTPVENSRISFDWEVEPGRSAALSRGLIEIEAIGLSGSLNGSVTSLDSAPLIDAEANLRLRNESWTECIQNCYLRGKSTLQLRAAHMDSAQRMRISGMLLIPGIDILQENIMQIDTLHGRLPFQVDLDPENGWLLPDIAYRPTSWIEYENRRSQFRSLNPDQGILFFEKAEVSGTQFQKLAMDVDIRRGYVQVPWFLIETLNGNVGGNMHLFLGDGRPETMAYEIHAQAARINSAALGNIQVKNDEEAELDATMAFRGLGVDIKKEMEIDGYFHITKIGPQFASLMLKGLDPNEEDRNIRLTRRLLDMGWKPKLFSFEMRHGYVYPSLALTQPWFSPLRLPETWSLGRQPLKFFLENPELTQAR